MGVFLLIANALNICKSFSCDVEVVNIQEFWSIASIDLSYPCISQARRLRSPARIRIAQPIIKHLSYNASFSIPPYCHSLLTPYKIYWDSAIDLRPIRRECSPEDVRIARLYSSLFPRLCASRRIRRGGAAIATRYAAPRSRLISIDSPGLCML